MQLSIRNLQYRRSGFSLSIDRLDLSSGKHFIMGANGSGKTTLMKIICGILSPESGSLMFDGVASERKKPWERHVAYIPQDLLLFPGMSVEKNLTFPVRHAAGSMDIYHDMVELMELKDLLQRRAGQISGGQAQRVAVARAIISRPSLLLMDEPLSMQDQSSRVLILSRLDSLMKKYSFSVLYVTHDRSDLDFGFDSITFMESGRIIENVSSMDEIKQMSSASMIQYSNIVAIDGQYYRADDNAIGFSNLNGYEYKWWKSLEYNVILLSIGSEEYFLRTSRTPDGKFITLDTGMLKPLQNKANEKESI